MTATALRTCPECGDVRRVCNPNTRPITRPCRDCTSRRTVKIASAQQERRPPAPRPLDPHVVTLLVLGIPERATVAERVEAVRRLDERGLTASEIAGRLGVTTRSVERYRARIRQMAA